MVGELNMNKEELIFNLELLEKYFKLDNLYNEYRIACEYTSMFKNMSVSEYKEIEKYKEYLKDKILEAMTELRK